MSDLTLFTHSERVSKSSFSRFAHVFVCKSNYKDCLIKELGIDTLVGSPTYTPTTLTKEEILDNDRFVLQLR
jgi:hypothetical protein